MHNHIEFNNGWKLIAVAEGKIFIMVCPCLLMVYRPIDQSYPWYNICKKEEHHSPPEIVQKTYYLINS